MRLDYTPLDEELLAKRRSRIRVSFVTPIAPASMLSHASRRCNARASMLCHRAATEDNAGGLPFLISFNTSV